MDLEISSADPVSQGVALGFRVWPLRGRGLPPEAFGAEFRHVTDAIFGAKSAVCRPTKDLGAEFCRVMGTFS